MTTDPGHQAVGPDRTSRFQGCLLGGAVGDALGAPVEFLSIERIRERFGAAGIRDYSPAYGGIGRITDDTQMTLFTAEGMLRAWVRASLRGITTYAGLTARAYLRWLKTQGIAPTGRPPEDDDFSGWLLTVPELHSPRAPGKTCISALREMRSLSDAARNNSKGCGGVMRVAPVGLFAANFAASSGASGYAEAFNTAVEIAAVTHGHPTGQLTAGVLASVVAQLVNGEELDNALDASLAILTQHAQHEETLDAVMRARSLAGGRIPSDEAIARLGGGWIAEEALAIGLYCALVAKDFESGVIMAVNHSGDSDSTGSIAGNVLGAILGRDAIPQRWLEPLELRAVISELATDLLESFNWKIGDEPERDLDLEQRVWEKYPGY